MKSNNVLAMMQSSLNKLDRRRGRERDALVSRYMRLARVLHTTYVRETPGPPGPTGVPLIYGVEYLEVPRLFVIKVKRWIDDVDGYVRRQRGSWRRPVRRPALRRALPGFGQAEEVVVETAELSPLPKIIAAGSIGVIVLGLVYAMGKETIGRAY